MSDNRQLTSRLRMKNPIVLAPMGGAGTVALAAAVCNAGGLGFIPAQYLTPQQIREWTAELRKLTDGPFGINLFAPTEVPPRPRDASRALELMRRFHDELGLPEPELPAPPQDDFAEKLQACLESGAKVFSFTFGIPPAHVIEEIRSRGMLFVGTATTVEEAVLNEEAGAEAVVAQGSEAGAHRGTFASRFEDALVGTMALVPQVVDSVSIPVLASGGIMDGRGIAAALALGAQAVQMGTAFLTTEEAAVPEAHKQAILNAQEHETLLTRAFSGRPARGLRNRVIDFFEEDPLSILPFPHQNAFTRPMRNAGAQKDDPDYLSLWAGQGVRMARRMGAADLVHELVTETGEAIARLAALEPFRTSVAR